MLNAIRNRRSIRKFTPEEVDDKTIDQIIEMGTWAPSGLNNQPWKFVVVKDTGVLEELSLQTIYSHIIDGAPVCIAVFLDNAESYNRVKDIQAIGACIQNMLLSIHHFGLGSVWLGEILKHREEVEEILGVSDTLELMAVIALGHPAEEKGSGKRKPLHEMIVARK